MIWEKVGHFRKLEKLENVVDVFVELLTETFEKVSIKRSDCKKWYILVAVTIMTSWTSSERPVSTGSIVYIVQGSPAGWQLQRDDEELFVHLQYIRGAIFLPAP